MKIKVNDEVKFKAGSLSNGTVKYLPEPDEPIIATSSPSSTVKLRPLRTCKDLLPIG